MCRWQWQFRRLGAGAEARAQRSSGRRPARFVARPWGRTAILLAALPTVGGLRLTASIYSAALAISIGLGLAIGSSWGLSSSAHAAVPAAAEQQPLELDEPLQPFVPRAARSEAETDHLQATALYAAARTHEQRQDYPHALRLYERAFRYDPQAMPVLREVIALAFNQERRAEAARYAQLIVGPEPEDVVLLRRLGIELADEGDWQGALKIYGQVAALEAGQKPSPNTVLWWMEMGRLYYLTKQYTLAADEFARVLESLEQPDDFGLTEPLRKAILGSSDLSYQLFGESFLEAGRTAEARANFEKSNSVKANEALLSYNLARVAARDKQPQQALDQLHKYLAAKTAGLGTSPYELLEELLKDTGHSEDLLPRLEKLAADDPDNVPLSYTLAEIYRQGGQPEKSEPLYRRLCRDQQQRPPVEAYRGLIEILNKADRKADLLEVLADLLGRVGSFDVLGETGRSLLADRGRVDALLAVARERRDGGGQRDRYGLWLAGALLALEAKQYDEAGSYFELALTAEPKKAPELLLAWGLELLADNQYGPAAKVFRRGIDDAVLPPDNPAFHYYLAGALEMAGQTDEALDVARRASELQKDSPRFAARAAWILYHAKRYDAAREAYTLLLNRFDATHDSTELRDVMHDARLVMSNIEVFQGNLPLAEEWLEQVLDEFPGDAGALNDLGYLWADESKHLNRSLIMIKQAVAAEPKNYAFRDSLGWAYYHLGQYDEALVELNAAAAVEQPDGTVLDHLGATQLASGDKPAALDSWSRALAAYEREKDVGKSQAIRKKIDAAKEAKP